MAIKNIYDTEISAPSFTWNGNTIATQAWVNANVGTPTLDAVTTVGNTTTNSIEVGPAFYVGRNISTTSVFAQLGHGRTGSGYAYIDLVGDTTYTDYGLRVIRYNTGANAASDIVHRGTGQFSIISNEAAPILFKTAAAERMRILPAGQVAIGRTTAFTVGGTATLSVNGDLISWGNSSTDLSYFRRLSTGNFQWQTYNGANAGNIHLQPYGGNVGIGTTSPSAILDVQDVPSGGSGTILNIGLDANNPVRAKIHTETYNGAFSLYDSGSNEDVKITTSGNSYFNGGNVGIGTTSPGANLHIAGGVTILGQNKIDGSSDNLKIMSDYANVSGNSTIEFSVDGSEKMRIASNGDVGIGTTSPSYKLHVVGEMYLDGRRNFGDSTATWYWAASGGKVNIDSRNFSISGDTGAQLHKWNRNTADTAYLPYYENWYDGNSYHSIGVENNTWQLSDGLAVGGVVSATGGSSTDWNTAYGWGDHASAGYLTSYTETDTLATVVARGAYFGTTNQGYVDGGGTYGTNLRKISRITLTYGGSNWNSDNHAILSKGLSGADDDSISINSYNGIHLRLDSNNNNANNTTAFTIHNDTTTSSNELFRINGDGNVGIGTTSPAYKLDVSGSSASVANLYSSGYTNLDVVSARTSGNLGGLRFKQNADTYISVELNGVVDGGLEVKTGNGDAAPSTRLKVDASGNVGIGNTSPDAKLSINTAAGQEGIKIRNVNSQDTFHLGHLSTEDSYLQMKNNAGTIEVLLRTDNGSSYINTGNVGIGTTSPTSKLHINYENAESVLTISRGGADLSAGTAIGTIQFNADYQGSPISYGSIDMYANSLSGVRSSLDFNVKSASGSIQTGLTVQGNNGAPNVGIGTTSPSSKLHIATNDAVAARIIGASSSYTSMFIGNTSTGAATVWLDAANGDLSGSDYAAIRQNDDLTLELYSAPLAGDLIMTPGGTERMRVKKGGNVGIGTTAPASELDINGAITFEGDTEHQIQKVTTSAITSAVTDTTQVSGRQIDLYAFDDVWLRAGTGDDIGFVAGGSTQMFIDGSASRVGIGTTSPGYTLDVNGSMHSTNITIADGIYHEGDTNTYISFSTDTINLNTGGGTRAIINNSGAKFNNDVIVVGGATLSLGERGEPDDLGRTVLIEGAANPGSGEGAGRIFFTEHNSTTTSADSYGLSLYYEGDPNIALPSGFQPNQGNATWSLRRHNNSVNGDYIMSGSRTNSDVTFWGNLTVPNAIHHQDDSNTYIQFPANDTWRVVTSGSERLRVTSTGNVGIGASSPSTKLQIGTGSVDDRIRVYYSDGTYSEQTGWGMEFARNASYLRPDNDNVRTLNVGDPSHTWATVNIDATALTWNTSTLATQSWVTSQGYSTSSATTYTPDVYEWAGGLFNASGAPIDIAGPMVNGTTTTSQVSPSEIQFTAAGTYMISWSLNWESLYANRSVFGAGAYLNGFIIPGSSNLQYFRYNTYGHASTTNATFSVQVAANDVISWRTLLHSGAVNHATTPIGGDMGVITIHRIA